MTPLLLSSQLNSTLFNSTRLDSTRLRLGNAVRKAHKGYQSIKQESIEGMEMGDIERKHTRGRQKNGRADSIGYGLPDIQQLLNKPTIAQAGGSAVTLSVTSSASSRETLTTTGDSTMETSLPKTREELISRRADKLRRKIHNMKSELTPDDFDELVRGWYAADNNNEKIQMLENSLREKTER